MIHRSVIYLFELIKLNDKFNLKSPSSCDSSSTVNYISVGHPMAILSLNVEPQSQKRSMNSLDVGVSHFLRVLPFMLDVPDFDHDFTELIVFVGLLIYTIGR